MKEIFNNDSDNKIENSNTIETLKYISQDLVGNIYVINADTAKRKKIMLKIYFTKSMLK